MFSCGAKITVAVLPTVTVKKSNYFLMVILCSTRLEALFSEALIVKAFTALVDLGYVQELKKEVRDFCIVEQNLFFSSICLLFLTEDS